MADNALRKFKFISPGVFVNEIDNSELPSTPSDIGPVVIGLAAKGPTMTPVTVNSFSEFVETFGSPVAGNQGVDIWRNRTGVAPTYGAYAAQAWLRNNSTLTFVRLRGDQDPNTQSTGKAGWKAGTVNGTVGDGGAWGLFVFPSSSELGATRTVVTGALAATIYCPGGRVVISGSTVLDASASLGTTLAASTLYDSNADGTLVLGISSDGTQNNMKKVKIDLNSSNQNFFREALNTNPIVTNSTITTAATRTNNQGGNYWVGESFEDFLLSGSGPSRGVATGIGVLGSNIKGTKYRAAILPLRNNADSNQQLSDREYAATKATTGWFIAQDLNEDSSAFVARNQQQLFRFEALTAGESIQSSIKISITDIKAPRGDFQDYGTFSVLIRSMSDNDNVPVILERYDNLNLNPASVNYIAKQIGDKYTAFDNTTKTNVSYGVHDNKSQYVRVVMNEDVDKAATTPAFLPFGVFGPRKYRDVTVVAGVAGGVMENCGGFRNAGVTGSTYASASRGNVYTMIDGGSTGSLGAIGGYQDSAGGADVNSIISLGTGSYSGSINSASFGAALIFPSVPLRGQSSWGAPKTLKNTYWGAWVGRSSTDVKINKGIVDTLRARASGLESNPASTAKDVAGGSAYTGSQADVISWCFTLDDISGSVDANPKYAYVSGSRAAGTSVSAASGSYTGSLNAGLDRFTTVLFGGSDGLDVTERNPFRNALMDDKAEDTSYELYSLKKAINIMADAEQTQYNLITMPGVTQALVTDHLLDVVEDRGDALAVIDIDKVYTPDTESTASEADRNNFTVKQAIDALRDRNINNSYGAAYYPWVKIQDTVTNRLLWAPPSVAALGALSSNDRQAAPWFAPAGFSRGGLSEGAGGIPVVDVSKRLTSENRDDLYEANINPIAKFPAEGIVIFGQKTLQQTASALDRINVRRLLIFLKREISFIASRMLFQQNTRDTWNVFQGKARPILESVKAEFGIDDFRLILDESTTTPDLIDRNIIYAKLIVKPTRSVEFFAIDFVVTNSGASFED